MKRRRYRRTTRYTVQNWLLFIRFHCHKVKTRLVKSLNWTKKGTGTSVPSYIIIISREPNSGVTGIPCFGRTVVSWTHSLLEPTPKTQKKTTTTMEPYQNEYDWLSNFFFHQKPDYSSRVSYLPLRIFTLPNPLL